MSEASRISNTPVNNVQYIDLVELFFHYLNSLKRYWYLLLALCLMGTALFYGYNRVLTVPSYQASCTYSVEKSSSILTNAMITERLATGINRITSTNDFHAEVDEILGQVKTGYTFTGKNTSSANLMTITVSCTDPDLCDSLLEAFDRIYPDWAAKLVGNCTLIKTDEVPCDGVNMSAWSKPHILVCGFAIGFLIWCGIMFLDFLKVRPVETEEDLEKKIQIPCLGVLPEIEKKKRDKSTREALLLTREHIDSGYRQSLRALCQKVEDLYRDKKKVFLITCTREEEGKSLITLNLAYALKNNGLKVMVVDADFYSSGIMRILNNEGNEKGLLNALQASSPEVLRAQNIDGISVLFGGKSDNVTVDTLNIQRFQKIIKKLREQMDVILIDSPPVSQVGDALLYSEAADGVFYVVRSDYLVADDIVKGLEPFYRNQKLCGYILNRLKVSGDGTIGRGNYYHYGKNYTRYGRYSRYRNYGEKINDQSALDWESSSLKDIQ